VALNKPDQEYPRGEEFSSPWRPFMDLTDQGDHYLLWVDLPGVLKEDCDLRVYDERLILEGERKCSEVEEQDRLRSERFFGTFSRELRLPPDVDTDRVSAEMQEGVLTVKLPKSTDLKAREVEIR
jgi:HSP20 family protein